jgi:hypothetical protein
VYNTQRYSTTFKNAALQTLLPVLVFLCCKAMYAKAQHAASFSHDSLSPSVLSQQTISS